MCRSAPNLDYRCACAKSRKAHDVNADLRIFAEFKERLACAANSNAYNVVQHLNRRGHNPRIEGLQLLFLWIGPGVSVFVQVSEIPQESIAADHDGNEVM